MESSAVGIIGASRKRSEILDQEIPDLEKAILRARHSQTECDFPHHPRGSGGDHHPHGPPTCCAHLRKILPDELDLEFCRTAHDGFFVKNPVHALHLESQFDPKEDITDWLVYGEEQERALAYTTPGIVETWSSTVKNDLYPEESNKKSWFKIASPSVSEGPTEAASSIVPTSQIANSGSNSSDQYNDGPPTATLAASSPTGGLTSPVSTKGTPASNQEEGKMSAEQYKHYAQAEEEIRRLRQVLIGRRKLPGNTKRPKLKVEGPTLIDQEEYMDYKETQRHVIGKANRILETYRQQRRSYWKRQEPSPPPLFGQIMGNDDERNATTLRCHKCEDSSSRSATKDLRRCLECAFIGCSEQHSFEHYLTTQHEFAVALDHAATPYCLPCCRAISHIVFDQEKVRIDVGHLVPWFAWREDILHRSFDCWRFTRQGYWKGFRASYPMVVSQTHVRAAAQCGKRKQDLAEKRPLPIPAPVGMYNLGNTCYLSSTLQALIHCVPLQRYFLEDVGHCHEACMLFKTCPDVSSAPSAVVAGQYVKMRALCLACEMDRLYTIYESSANGYATWQKGSPLVTANILSSCWRAMEHLAGSEQRDAHEFLHGFLELVGKNMSTFRAEVRTSLGDVAVVKSDDKKDDEIKNLFEGKLRSVLICQECGNKRSQEEAFLCLSLPLEKAGGKKLTVEKCLYDFTLPESLSDPVQCPSCGRKTPTQKQHVLCKLPKVLILHLKRFDAMRNRKIEDLVDFEAVLNMGFYLPHWSEVTRLEQRDGDDPVILYDLFATSNHYGTLESGHYVANVKVEDHWYLINDAHVAFEAEADVLRNQSAYMLFYIRR